jgi:glutathione S-transferase
LIVGDLRVDPASLVAFLALVRAGAEPAVEVLAPTAADRAARLAAVSPTSRLPVLVEHGTTVWELLAILEWAAERAPGLWPAHARRRAVARAVIAEAHGGYAALRQHLPVDWFARYRLREELPAAVQVDLHRLARLWSELLEDGDGFLFGPRPGLADLAMVPMAARLRTYDLWPRNPGERAYAERLLALDEVVAAFAEATPEPALSEPPALAVSPAEAVAAAVPGASRRAAPTPPPAETAAPSTAASPAAVPARPAAPAPGPRKLEDVVARARQRDRPGGAAARPLFEPLPSAAPTAQPRSDEAPRATEPAGEPVAPAPPARGEAAPSEPPAAAREGEDRAARPSGRGGLGWLRGRGRGEPPGGGRRRRPPGRG